MVFEVWIKFTRPRKICLWYAPIFWLGILLRNVFGDLVTREEPNLNSTGIPESCINPTSDVVESCAKRIICIALHPAALVEGRCRWAIVMNPSARLLSIHIAVVWRMKRHQIFRLLVNTLYNINLTTVGPIRTIRPAWSRLRPSVALSSAISKDVRNSQGWPRPALSSGHVPERTNY